MDVKEILEKLKDKLEDKSFIEAVKSDPVKAIEDAIGVKIPAEQVEAVVVAVKAKVEKEGIASVLEEAEEKLEDVKEKLGGLFGGKDK